MSARRGGCRIPLLRLGLLLCLGLSAARAPAAETPVTIRADFPGGNVRVLENEGGAVRLAPDLRGGQPWFYWHFEARAAQPGRATFTFPDAPRIGVRGPAVSSDDGKSWRWLGAERVRYAPPGGKPHEKEESFPFDFTEAGQRVRFAVAIPYLQRDLDNFLAMQAANPHLIQSTLTKTRRGRRPVELLQVGKPGPGVSAVLLTARHHACESMASYVMEGFLGEALSDSPAAATFRKKYVLYAVPLVDKDGVQEGDQGKNRAPHDHNRDYGKDSIYPEVQAIQDLAEVKKVRYSLDLHCPFLRGDVHEAFHFLGLGVPHVRDNVDELIAWLREERPPVASAPLNFLADPRKPGVANPKINSHHFALREHAVVAATLEVPYTQANCPLDADLARQYGVALLRAWVRTRFVTAAPDDGRGSHGNARLLAFRAEFQRTYRGKPQEAEGMANAYLEDRAAPAVYRAEANSLMAALRLHQRRFGEALRFNEAVVKDANATSNQRATAVVRRVQIIAADPDGTADDVEAGLAGSAAFPYLSAEQRAKAYEATGEFYHRKQDNEKALGCARKQLAVTVPHEKGRALNRMATLQDLLGRPGEAVASRKEAVRVLRPQLDPVPVSVFGAQMAADLFEAVSGIPTATRDEKREAAAMVLDHKVTPAAMKEKVRKALADLDKE